LPGISAYFSPRYFPGLTRIKKPLRIERLNMIVHIMHTMIFSH
jgi:hypothetical protein